MDAWRSTTGDSRERWNRIADCYDERMGDDGNRHSLELVFPDTERFLNPKPGETILEAACGNGTFSRRLARFNCNVLAFDYSENMIEHAKSRTDGNVIDYRVIDATNLESLLALGTNSFDKAVCNMAIHDISDIGPLFNGVYQLLKPGSAFVFSTMHPCFRNAGAQKVKETLEDEGGVHDLYCVKIYNYHTPMQYMGYAIATQQVAHLYYHRSLSLILQTAFSVGFIITGLSEPVFDSSKVEAGDWTDIPAVIIVKLEKQSGR